MKALILLVVGTVLTSQAGEDWLTWSESRARGIGKAAYATGRVGGFFDTRLLKTERSYNYKLAATWLTPDVIRATARIAQLNGRLSDADAKAMVAEADAAGDTVVMVEIDPREGSGVIPTDWSAFLQPVLSDGAPGKGVRGVDTPKLRDVKALAGTLRRNYDYDRFWVVFPLTHEDGTPVLQADAVFAELVVRINDREGRTKWPIPVELNRRLKK